jgi:hypothetical protein
MIENQPPTNQHQQEVPSARAHETTRSLVFVFVIVGLVLLLALIVPSDYVHRMVGAYARVPPCDAVRVGVAVCSIAPGAWTGARVRPSFIIGGESGRV